MYFCYFDESGDSGMINSPSKTFTLSAVVVHESVWLDTLNQLINFRRFLRDNFNIPLRTELKSQWLVQNKGYIRKIGLSYSARMSIYESCMRFQRKCNNIKTFAVVINKDAIRGNIDPRDKAWEYTLQRIERFGTANQERTQIFPDEGHGYFIRRKIRKIRRISYIPSAFNDEVLDRRAENILEDSSDRKSNESYFIQMADLNAYAAFRKVHPTNSFDGKMWDTLGDARILAVNNIRGGPAGIVSWP